MTTTTDRPATRRPSPLLLNGARLLLGLLGAAKLYGTSYFTFVATAEEGGVQTSGDWLVAAWSASLAVVLLVAAVRLGRDRWVLPLLGGALLADLVFGSVKFLAYDEQESLGIGAVSLVVMASAIAVARRAR
jgi:hypothetical protein